MSIRRSLFLSLLQRYGSLGIGFLGTMIVSRLISPEEFGIYFVAAGLLMIAGTISQFGIGVYLIQEKALTREMAGTAFSLLLITSAVVAVLVFVFRHEVAMVFGDAGVADVLAVTALVLLASPWSTPCTSMLQRRMRFDLILVVGVGGSAVQAATAVILALAGFSYMSLAWAALAEQVAIMALVVALSPRDVWVRPTLSQWRRVVDVGGAITASHLLSQMGSAAPQLALGRWTGFEAVGLFTRGRSLFDLFNRGFMQGITPVLLPALSEISRGGGSFERPIALAFTHLGAIAWPFFALLALFAEPVIRVLFGPQWPEAAPIVQILCLLGLAIPITSYTSDVLIALGRSRLWLGMESCSQTVKIVAVILAAMVGLQAVAWALVGAQIVTLVLALWAMHRVVGLSARSFVRPGLKNFAIAAATVAGPLAVVLLAGEWSAAETSAEALVRLIAIAPLAMFGWLASLYLTGHPLWAEGTRLLAKSRIAVRLRNSRQM